jgi:photosystem II stability/assembly factor-like uncharacterized protein
MRWNVKIVGGLIVLALTLQACSSSTPPPAPTATPAPTRVAANTAEAPAPRSLPSGGGARDELPPTLPPRPTPAPSPTPLGGGVEADFYDINLEETDIENFDERIKDLTSPLVSADGAVNRGVLLAAYKELAKYKPVGGAWRGIGPAPIASVNMPQGQIQSAGKVDAFAMDPRDSNVLYVALGFGGLWKTTDSGKTWQCLTDQQVPMVIGGVELDPQNPDLVYALLGEFAPSLIKQYPYLANGILRSRDGGKTWKLIGADAFNGATVSALVFDSTGAIFAASGLEAPMRGPAGRADFGIFKSTDGGDTWQRLIACEKRCAPPSSAEFVDIAGGFMDLDITTDDTLYATMCHFFCWGTSILRSRDGGKTWQELNYGSVLEEWEQEQEKTIATGATPDVPHVEGLALAVAQTNPKVLLAGGGIKYQAIRETEKEGELSIKSWSFVMRSLDGGDTWEWLPGAGDYCTGTGGNMQCPYDNIIEIDPTDEKIMYVGGSFSRESGTYFWNKIIQRSADGGKTWADMNPSNNKPSWMHPDSHALLVAPKKHNVVWVGTDGGIYRTEEASAKKPVWAHMSKGIDTLLFIDIGLHPTDRNYIIGGLQDNGIAFTTDGGKTWPGASQGDAGYSAVDPFEPDIVYSTWPQGGFQRNLEGGVGQANEGWFEYTDGLDPSDEWAFYAPFVVDPKNEGVIYIASNRVYKSTNRGEDWVPASDYFDTEAWHYARTLAIGINDTKVLYAGLTTGKVWVTTDGGRKWADVTGPNFPERQVNRIMVDPSDARIAYAVYGGFNVQTPGKPGHIFRTADAGKTWQDISHNLPDAPLGAGVVDTRANYAGVYVGGSLGVWVLKAGAKQWLPYGTNMPYALITDLELNPKTGIMAAATYGRSIWVIDMP